VGDAGLDWRCGMTRAAVAMPDEPDDGGAGWNVELLRELLRHGLALKDHGAGSSGKVMLVRSMFPADLDPQRAKQLLPGVPCSSDWLKRIDLDVVVTTNYDRLLVRRVQDGCLVAEARMVLPVATGRSWYARMSPQRLTGIAVIIAGRERADLGEEWRAHLCEQTGRGLPADQQAMEAVGFVRAAVLCRAEDVEDWLWDSVDAVLSSRWISSLFVLLAMVSIAVVFIRQGGLYGLADNIGGVAVVFATALGVIHVGRKVRDVKPPEHKPRRERHQR
jgi:hypothetical protein